MQYCSTEGTLLGCANDAAKSSRRHARRNAPGNRRRRLLASVIYSCVVYLPLRSAVMRVSDQNSGLNPRLLGFGFPNLTREDPLPLPEEEIKRLRTGL